MSKRRDIAAPLVAAMTREHLEGLVLRLCDVLDAQDKQIIAILDVVRTTLVTAQRSHNLSRAYFNALASMTVDMEAAATLVRRGKKEGAAEAHKIILDSLQTIVDAGFPSVAWPDLQSMKPPAVPDFPKVQGRA